jgi:malonyl-CoA O-methyltransferase
LNGACVRAEAEAKAKARCPDPADMKIEAPEELSVLDGYSAWASFYDDDGNPLTALEGPAVARWLGPLEGRRALDLGCGTGRHTVALAAAGAQVAALDMTPEMLARARAKLPGEAVGWVRHVLPRPLPFREAAFDVVVLGLVAEHVADLARLLGEGRRVLAPSGRLILSALHPERTAEGQRARFIDPQTGRRRPIQTFHRTSADYLEAAAAAGLHLEAARSLVVPAALAERLPRARPYVGRPLGWVACWTRA